MLNSFVTRFNKKIIAKNFSRGAKNYDEFAFIQKIVAQKLCNFAASYVKENSKILDLGSGTSFIAKQFSDKKNLQIFEIDLALDMLKSWDDRPSNIFPIQSDLEKLPLKNNSFDIILSSFSLQWINDFEKNFSQFFSLLKPQGIFAFSLPVTGSLRELDSANIFNFNELPAVENLTSALKKSGFTEILFEQETLKQEFTKGSEALKSLKKIGANHAEKNRNSITKTQLKEFDKFCLKNFSTSNKNIAISWNISYFILKK